MDATSGPDGRGGPHVFVGSLEAPVLDPGDHHHLAKSLRLRDGDPLTLSDGRGHWCAARFDVRPEVCLEVFMVPALPPVGVGFALVKGSKPELVVQKLTELGVDAIAVFAADRSVVRWDDARQAKNQRRLEIVAREAAMQSRRVRLPELLIGVSFVDLAGRPSVALADPGSEEPAGGPAPSDPVRWILIGPEGGWTDDERQRCPRRVSLGPTILRAETAAIAAGVRLTSNR
ncbi:MAG: 16S rRNA (uracil(1498)-N(3))-methyltransferase [Acidimicrobiales bacterium]|nr:16S rRNA (uracil(1498)-N(3))-methyltransferase [Acidimicrobiales bacterium]